MRTENAAAFFIAIAVFVVALYVSNLNDYYYGKRSDIKPLYFHLMTLGFASIALLSHQKAIIDKFPTAVLIWIGVFLGLLFTSFLTSSQSEAALAHLTDGLKAAALLFAFIVLVAKGESKAILNTLIAIVILSVCLNFYDFVLPSFSKTYGRAAGLYGNANIAGKTIAIAMVLSCAAVPKRWRMAYCLFAGVGILVTFSRSSWLLWAIGITGLAATGRVFLRSRYASVLVLGGVGLLTIYALLGGTMLSLFESLGFDQYLTSGTISRLGGSGAALQDASVSGRIDTAWYGLSEFQKHPWFGSGLGATSEWLSVDRPHNLYLMYAVEAGIVGLLVILALIGVLWSQVNSIGRVAVILYAASSFFTHNNLEQAHMLCLLAITIVMYPRENLWPEKPAHYVTASPN